MSKKRTGSLIEQTATEMANAHKKLTADRRDAANKKTLHEKAQDKVHSSEEDYSTKKERHMQALREQR